MHLSNIFYYLNRLYYIFINIIIYKPIFRFIDIKALIKSPLQIDNPSNICIGRCYIGYKSWLAANPLTGQNKCRLTIGDGCQIGHFNHIYATGEIIIEENVLTADKVYIADNLHGYEDITTPIHKQPIKQNGHVTIGEGSWLGENVCVLGASVGKHSVIGANSVVTHNIPDYCVAVGSPARIIKRYNGKTQRWEKTDKHGSFIEK